MKFSTDNEWPNKLQAAAHAANTQFKRSLGYTPFRLMFGSEYDSSDFLNILATSFDKESTSDDSTMLSCNENVLATEHTVPVDIDETNSSKIYPTPNHEWHTSLEEDRRVVTKSAQMNVRKEQTRQKRILTVELNTTGKFNQKLYFQMIT